jgi:uncharacterized membrane protein
MFEFLQSSGAQAIVWFALLALLIVIGVYLVNKVRGDATDDRQVTSELMTDFEELHDQGELSDTEYRTIKSNLSARLQQQLREQSGRKD